MNHYYTTGSYLLGTLVGPTWCRRVQDPTRLHLYSSGSGKQVNLIKYSEQETNRRECKFHDEISGDGSGPCYLRLGGLPEGKLIL